DPRRRRAGVDRGRARPRDHALGRLAARARAGAERRARRRIVRRRGQLSADAVGRLDAGRSVMAESESLEGTVLRVVFAAPDGAFAVVRLDVAGRDQPVTVTGPLSETTPGELLKLEGHWETHKVHGEQFRATRAVVEVPRTGDGIERYLQGIKGIGPELARRLVAAFGVSAVEVIEKEPWRAAQVKGMGKRRAERAS